MLKTIERYAFSDSEIRQIVLPPSIEKLKKGWCRLNRDLSDVQIARFSPNFKKIENFIIGKNNKEYDVLIFANKFCPTLNIPPYIKTIYSDAFYKCIITNITIPPNVTEICDFAFSFCEELKEVEILPNSQLKIIGDSAFKLTKIESIKIPQHVTKIGKNAFSDCSWLNKIEFSEYSELEIIETCAFEKTAIRKISIPQSVTEICDKAFNDCSNLREIIFSKEAHLITIGKEAFKHTLLSHTAIPSSVKYISNDAFDNSNIDEY